MPSDPRVRLATDRLDGSETRDVRQPEPPPPNTFQIRWITLSLLMIFVFGAHAETLTGRVVGVTDGDTVTVLDVHNVRHKIRLSGIDAPEITQAYGTRSKKHLSDLVFRKDVWVKWHKRDRYGRIVGKVILRVSRDCPSCAKGIDAGHAQLGSGLAWWYRKYADEQSPDDRKRYESEEAVARDSRLGLWSDAAPLPPWQFRKTESRTSDSSSDTRRRNQELAKKIISESIARFPGKCPCPYSIDRAGRRCGARSAYAKPRGLSPMCYESDVPDRMLRTSQ